MEISRRAAIAGILASCAPTRSRPPLPGRLLGAELAERGHRLRAPGGGASVAEGAVDVAIVGAGVAGLVAAWRLARAGFRGSVRIFELGDAPGGTAAAGRCAAGDFPLGAHYVTLPNRENTLMLDLLQDLGVIVDRLSGGPRYDPMALCWSPEERVWVGGEWMEDLWPSPMATGEDARQKQAFDGMMAELAQRVGSDGRPMFSIPVSEGSADAEPLREGSFAAWLDAQGLDSPLLRWLLDYCCRDDFGVDCAGVSAWAGLHYHCARRPFAGEPVGTHVLTWPEGNARLVAGLAAGLPWKVETGALVRAVEADRLHVELGGGLREIRFAKAILAVPGYVAARLGLPREGPAFAPWRTVHLQCDRLPASRGLPFAWDSVVYGGRGLGYVSSVHQGGRLHAPAVLSWYEPVADRKALQAEPWEAGMEAAFQDLAPAHSDLRERVQAVEVMHWGHGTAIPAPRFKPATPGPVGNVHFAHTDLSGMSLFEEAAFHGDRAAGELLGG